MTATQEYFATKLKLWTGMFLMFYCVTHHMNHSLGIFGLTVVDYAREYFLLFWRNPVISFFLLFTLVIHIIFSLLRVIKMVSFKGYQIHEWFQLITGILTVPLLATPQRDFSKIVVSPPFLFPGEGLLSKVLSFL